MSDESPRGSVLILTGQPGAGKTTIADLLTRTADRPAVHLHSDDFFGRSIKSGFIPPWTAGAHTQNMTITNVLVAAAFAYAEGSDWVILDGVVGP